MKDRSLRDKLINNINLYLQEINKLNDFIANNPEIGMEEYKSSAAIVKLLRDNGIETQYPFADIPTAFKGCINPEKTNRVALLAEYDALRGQGHACGHCASGSASVLAALALNKIKDQLHFGVDIIGTPDEEINGCKCKMADDGVFDKYDFAAMVHMGGINATEVNFIALDGLGIKFRGKAAHAASAPDKGHNALNAARLFLDATDMMRQHITPEARMHGIIKNGGQASNIVPDFAELEFLTRAPKREVLNDITSWVKECAAAAAMATRTDVEICQVGLPFHELHVSDLQNKIMKECYSELGISVVDGKLGMTGSSDIGNVDYVCPAFHPIMSIGKSYDCHTIEFANEMTSDNTHNAIKNAASVLVSLITKLYGDADLMKQIKCQHKEYRGY